MSIWVMADLHLSFGTDKPMDGFYGWKDYISKIETNWKEQISNEDTVIIPGDFSWGLGFEQALPDFEFIEKLPGRKILMKGNHDYWWTTRTKTEKFFYDHNLKSIEILHNNSIYAEGLALCGTRGWVFMPNEQHDVKISAREALRLKLSIEDANNKYPNAEKVVFLHYPPVYANEMVPNIISVLKENEIKSVYYGHLHGSSRSLANEGEYMGIQFRLVSADHLKFKFWKIK